MSKSPTVKLSEGYTQFWPLHQSQTDWVSTVKRIHLNDFVKYAAEDRPTRGTSGGEEENLKRFIRVHFQHKNTNTQHHFYYDNNKG